LGVIETVAGLSEVRATLARDDFTSEGVIRDAGASPEAGTYPEAGHHSNVLVDGDRVTAILLAP